MLPADVYVQPRAADPVLAADVVLGLVRRHVSRAVAVTAVDESGGEARAYAIDGDVILKTQRPQQLRSRTSLEKEALFLAALAGDPEVRVPRVLGYGRVEGVEYLCMTRMPGVAARTVVLAGREREGLLRALGRMLRRVHALPQAQFFASPLFPGPRTVEEFGRRFEMGLQDAVLRIERERTLWTLALEPGAVAEVARAALPARLKDIELAALHSNPGPEHVFVEPTTHALSGLIDFGDAYIAHPAFDWRWPDHADRLALLAGYAEEGTLTDAFLAAWRASLLLADLTAVATRPERRAVALHGIAALLA
jgi:Ser/Thr protein kinase RdoA (MazF antagonist)